VIFQELDVTLTHHSGRAEDADWIFVLHASELSSVQEVWALQVMYSQDNIRVSTVSFFCTS
jgi:hypothetical protein